MNTLVKITKEPTISNCNNKKYNLNVYSILRILKNYTFIFFVLWNNKYMKIMKSTLSNFKHRTRDDVFKVL